MGRELINWFQKAAAAWPILVEQAESSEVIYYKPLGDRIDVHHRHVNKALGAIQEFCIAERLPPLTSLVVNADTKLPGGGFDYRDYIDLRDAQSAVRNYKWASISNPFTFSEDGLTAKKVVDGLIDGTLLDKRTLQIVERRGYAQFLLRQALLAVYDRQCCMCDCNCEAALEAAHIKPWAACATKEKLDTENLLLLCANHHRMFDSNLVVVGEDMTILSTKGGKAKKVVGGQFADELQINVKQLRAPKDPQRAPSKEYIRYRLELLGLM